MLTQVEAAARAGVSLATWNKVENGRGGEVPQVANRRKISKALGWTPDSVDRVLRGEKPVVDMNSPVLHEMQAQSDAALMEESRLAAAKSTGEQVAPHAPDLAVEIAKLVAEVRGLRADVADLKKKAR